MVLEDRLIRDLPEKHSIDIEDFFVVEDLDGTKLASARGLRQLVMDRLIFDNIESMKMAKLNAGDYCITLGYHTAGDGGAALYHIVYEPTAIDDKANWHYLHTSDTNRAKFIPQNGVVTPEQFGAYGDGSRDDIGAITKCLDSKYRVMFSRGKIYKISSPIELKINANVDLNGCTIKPENCTAFAISSTVGAVVKEHIKVMNGKIDMSGAVSSTVFNFIRSYEASIENITVFGGFGKVIHSSVAGKRLSVRNCIFSSTSVTSIAITIDPNDIDVYINDVTFKNYTRAISVVNNSNSGAINLYVTKCSLRNVENTATTTFLYNDRSGSAVSVRQLYLDSIYTEWVTTLFNTTGNDDISIKDIKMVNAQNLFRAPNMSGGSITIEGSIRLDGDYSATKYPVFHSSGGRLYINTLNIVWNSSRHSEKAADSNFNACKLYDMVPMQLRDTYGVGGINGTFTVNGIRNLIIHMTLSSATITRINGGINGQVICLTTNTNVSISNSAYIALRGASSKTITPNDRLYLRYNANKWTEI